ncbi:MAG: hypothetical protein MPF33_02280 [Candidatus Aramenus sp.]|jgi:hypothetical protein|nr:hypothetical protein [Candidatus Aramenus sp.]
MESAISTFILAIATVVIGVVLFGLISSYVAVQATTTNEIKEAQALASTLQIREQISYGEAIVVPYLPGYSRLIYVVAFNVPQNLTTAESLSLITPSMGTPVEVNYTSGVSTSITVYSTSGKEIYSGPALLYNTTSNSVSIISLPTHGYTVVWFMVDIDGKLYRIGYLEL